VEEADMGVGQRNPMEVMGVISGRLPGTAEASQW
jgi:hypothetical protein